MEVEINKTLSSVNLGNRLVLDGRPFVGGVCLHDTAGSGTHNDTLYLRHPGDGRKVSVDFTVERDGTIYQLNPDLTRRCTFHAGRATQWKAAGRIFRNKAVTQVLIGIELVQKHNLSLVPVWPDVQVEAVADLCVYLCEKFNLTKDQITTHKQIIRDGSRSDPRQFPFNKFWERFNASASTSITGVAEGSGSSLSGSVTYRVVSGDSLWKISNKFGVPIETIKSLNNIGVASNLIVPGQLLLIRR